MTRARDLANFADDTAGLETLTVSDVTDLSVSASNINSATNQITDSSTDLNVDSNTLVVDKSENKVGIGTASPDELLHLKSSTSLNPILKIENTNADHLNAQINFIKNSASEADDDYLGQIDFEGLNDNDEMIVYGRLQSQAKDVSDGTEDGRVYISAMVNGTLDQTFNVVSGDVGIGTPSPQGKLNIVPGNAVEGVRVSGTNNTLGLSLAYTDAGHTHSYIYNKYSGNDDSDIILGFGSSYGSGTVMTLKKSGNVGIGLGSTSPTARVHLSGTGTGGNASFHNYNTSSDTFIHNQWNLASNMTANQTNVIFVGKEPNTKNSGWIGYKWVGNASNDNTLSFGHWGADHLMNLTANGKVGFGTTSPNTGTRVHIKNTDDTRGLYIENTDSSSYAEVHLKASREFRIGTGNSSSDVQARDRFYIYDATANAHRFTLDASGKVGIGTSSPDATILTGKTTGSTNSEIYLGATGSGNASVVLDASNGDFSGSDYYMLRHMDSTLDVENWLGISGDYIWKTNAGTERVRLYNNGTLKHVSGNTQLAYEQYSYGTSSFSSNGNWHTMLSGLTSHHVFLVRMYQSGSGFHTSALFIAANTYGSGNIFTFSSGSGWSSNVELRWTGSTYNYNLEGRSTGTNSALTYWRIKLINI